MLSGIKKLLRVSGRYRYCPKAIKEEYLYPDDEEIIFDIYAISDRTDLTKDKIKDALCKLNDYNVRNFVGIIENFNCNVITK